MKICKKRFPKKRLQQIALYVKCRELLNILLRRKPSSPVDTEQSESALLTWASINFQRFYIRRQGPLGGPV